MKWNAIECRIYTEKTQTPKTHNKTQNKTQKQTTQPQRPVKIRKIKVKQPPLSAPHNISSTM